MPKFVSDILAKAGLTVDGVVTLNSTATGQTPASNDNSTKLATTAWVRTYVAGAASSYTLPTASASVLGGIKVGTGLSISGTGVLSATGSSLADVQTVQSFTATEGQTTVTVANGYVPGLIKVFVNGVFQNAAQYTANGSTVVFNDVLALDDIVDVIITSPFYTGQLPDARQEYLYTATAGQTIFTADYIVGQLDIFYNGSKISSANYTANNGTSVTLGFAASAGDIVEIHAWYNGLGISASSFSATAPILYNSTTKVFSLATSGATAGSYGSSSAIPTLTVDAYGRITSISTTAVQIVSSLSGLSDVALSSPSDGQLLQYNSSSSKWENTSPGYATINYVSSTYLPLSGGTVVGSVNFGPNPATGNGIIQIVRSNTSAASEIVFLTGSAGNWSIGNYGAGASNTLGFYNNTGTEFVTFLQSGATTFTNSVTASSFVKSGGTSSQFLKADGSVDSSIYATQTYVGTQISNLVNAAPSALDTLNELAAALGNDANFATTVTNSIATKATDTAVVHKTGNETIAGIKTFTDKTQFNSSILLSHDASLNPTAGYTNLKADASGIYAWFGTNSFASAYLSFQNNTQQRNYIFPDAGGTIALTSDFSGYVPTSRTLNINGTIYDLSANRGWTIDIGVASFNARTGNIALTSVDVTNALTYTPANDTAVVHITGAETITGVKTFNPTVTASAGVGRGLYINPSVTASANGDTLVGLDIAPSFSNGGFSGLNSYGIRIGGDIGLRYDTNLYRLNIGSGTPANTANVNVVANTTTAGFSVKNTYTVAGTNQGGFYTENAAGSRASFIKTASVYTAYKVVNTNDAAIYNSISGNLVLFNDFSTGNITLTAGAVSTAQATLFSTGNFVLNSNSDSGYKFDVNGTARIQSDATITGNLFMGVTSSSYRVTVQSANNDVTSSSIYLNNTNAGTAAASYLSMGASGAGGWIGMYSSVHSNGSWAGRMVIGMGSSGNGISINASGGASQDIQFAVQAGTVLRMTPTANVLIGTVTDVTTSILTLSSTTKGFLPPRMTAAQRTAITSPATGLVVYQTDGTEGLYIKLASGWKGLVVA